MRTVLPPTVSPLLDPADEPYLRLLLHCARARRELGLPALGHAEIEALLDRSERRVADDYAANVVPLRRNRRRTRNVER